MRVGRALVYVIASLSVSSISSSTLTGIRAHGIHTISIHVTVVGVGAALLQICKTSKVEAIIAWHVIPSVAMPHAKSVHTVFVVPVVWLLWSPEPKTANFFVCPHKRAFNTAVIQPYP